MAEIFPFRGIRYDPSAVGDLARVVAPPYDVISDADRDELEAASPYNVVRLILGRDEPGDDERSNKYTRARGLLETWQAAGILRQDGSDALYVYEQRYRVGADDRVQRGVLGAVRLDDPAAGGVLPHERTYDKIVQDRLKLLRATEANVDTIFCVYDGQDGAAHEAIERAADCEPLSRFITPDGIEHVLWAMTDVLDIASVGRALEKAHVVIADGHHRWQTALHYRNERRAAEGLGPWDLQLMFIVDATHWGPSLLPIHRVLSGIDASHALERLGPVVVAEPAPRGDPERLARELASRRARGRTFAMFDHYSAWWLTIADPAAERAALPAERSAAWRDLDVSVLHGLLFEQLLGNVKPRFVHSATDAADEVKSGRASLAFLLAPMPFEAVRAVAEAGEAMPQKSTFFVPKPATGVVMRALE
ncbi:MAG: DUF1015 domain-containing protein [Actinomycetota bacterium]